MYSTDLPALNKIIYRFLYELQSEVQLTQEEPLMEQTIPEADHGIEEQYLSRQIETLRKERFVAYELCATKISCSRFPHK